MTPQSKYSMHVVGLVALIIENLCAGSTASPDS